MVTDPTVMVAGIGGLATILAATLPMLLRGRRDIRHVKEQVTNSHTTNLRDDISAIAARVDLVLTDTAWMRREQTDLAGRIARLEERGT